MRQKKVEKDKMSCKEKAREIDEKERGKRRRMTPRAKVTGEEKDDSQSKDYR
jgi:hypothetical protein